MKAYYRYVIVVMLCCVTSGCKKYLDEKPDKSLVVPENLSDLQALLDNNNVMNAVSMGFGEGSSDNYYLTYADWSSLITEGYKNNYIWEKELFYDAYPNMWSAAYRPVYYANLALENIQNIERNSGNAGAWDNVKGSALFFRARSFQTLVVTFAKQYDKNTAASDLGIPLRLNSDFNEVSVRGTVEQTYNRIISDLTDAVPLLPSKALTAVRPSKPAAYSFLARTYLSMREYDKAGEYADSCLQVYDRLLDYNTLNATAAFPVPRLNAEVVFYSTLLLPQNLNNSRAKIDSFLYKAYENNDLRKTIFFRNNGNGTFGFKGGYNQSISLFDGIASDEMYLVKAESLARKGLTNEAMTVLNQLLVTRWKKGTFVPFTASTAGEALQKILAERRKELLMRDLRWTDLKRLNMEAGFETTVKRILNGQVYELAPGDLRYALPLPAYILQLTGMPQNPR